MNMKSVGLVVAMLASFSGTGATCQNSSGQTDVGKDKPEVADVKVEGVDTSSLTTREKKEVSQYVSELLSPCQSVPVPIAQCVNEKRQCAKCLPAAKYVLKGVRDGMSREQIEKAYKNRFDPEKVKNVVLDGSPAKGPDSAAIVMVEFADFECPHCGLMAPIIEKAWEEHKTNVKFVYKFMPLGGHPHAEPAARAAIAAMNQGKFWEMHGKLYANQQHLEQGDLDLYAKDLGLDIGKFKADMVAASTKDRLDRDRKQADALEVKGTPTLYINGREYDMKTDLHDWFSQELASAGGAPPPAPAPAPSASALLPIGSDSGATKDAGAKVDLVKDAGAKR